MRRSACWPCPGWRRWRRVPARGDETRRACHGARVVGAEGKIRAEHFPFVGDKLIIGKFCAIASDVRINALNHPMERISQHKITYRPNEYFVGSKIDKGFDKPLLHTVRGAGYMVRDGAG